LLGDREAGGRLETTALAAVAGLLVWSDSALIGNEAAYLGRLYKRAATDLQGRQLASTKQPVEAAFGDPQYGRDLVERQKRPVV
jgi:hypothetical protein